jgi:aldehyde dehydrogenase (NAD+)
MSVSTDIPVLSTIISDVFRLQQKHVKALGAQPVKARKEKLTKLRDWIHTHRNKIQEAAYADFQKASQEVDAIEIFHVLSEIKLAVDNLDTWASPRKVDAPLTMLGTRSFVQFEPRGVCLIISPWNYPFSLAVGPLVSAIAAGNAVIIKPSEMTPHVSGLIREMVSSLFKPEEVSVFEGDASVSQELLRLPFDHIFFTGSPRVGKVVMKAAAEHLTSVTLELGGKSPTFVTADADLNDAAQRIAIGKFVNNGQTCVAPDYILADEKIKDKLIQKIKERTVHHFFGKGTPQDSGSYCRIVNPKHFTRIKSLVEDAVSRGANVEWDGNHDERSRFMHPMILSNVPLDAEIMEEEIFGPVLPVLSYSDLDQAIEFVNSKPKALALYIFSSDKKKQQKILSGTSAGGVCINDCGVHFLNHNLPFGGINNSGLGKSHGYYGFLSFSNEKGVLRQKSGLTTLKPFYPPYTAASKKLMDWFLKLF